MDKITLRIMSPTRILYNGEVVKIITQNVNGFIEILKNHLPLVTLLKPSITEFTDIEGKIFKVVLSYGVMKVKNNKVEILCDSAEWPGEIDLNRAEEAKLRAEERISQKDGIDVKRAEMALLRSINRLKSKELKD